MRLHKLKPVVVLQWCSMEKSNQQSHLLHPLEGNQLPHPSLFILLLQVHGHLTTANGGPALGLGFTVV